MKLSWGADTYKGQGFRLTRDEAAAAGAMVLDVNGSGYRRSALDRDCFCPGNPVRLVPGPAPTDPEAIAVFDASGEYQVGYVPREETDSVRKLLAGGPIHATAIWEWIDGEGRRGIRILLSTVEPKLVEDESWGTRILEL